MRGINNVSFGGNLTRDPELRTTPSGKSVCTVTIAANRFRGSDDQNEEVCFIKCTAWEGRGEVIAKFCKKGDPLYVQGYLKPTSWTDKGSGEERNSYEICIQDFTFLSSHGNSEDRAPEGRSQSTERSGAGRRENPPSFQRREPEADDSRGDDIPW